MNDRVVEQILGFFEIETEYPRTMLQLDADMEADLGIDSMTLTSILDRVGEEFGIDPNKLQAQQFSTIRALVTHVKENWQSRSSEIAARVLEVIARETQYSADGLQLEAELEAELGIDSMLLTSILAEIGDQFGIPASDLQSDEISTIAALIDRVDQLAAGRHGNAPAEAAEATPQSGAATTAATAPEPVPSELPAPAAEHAPAPATSPASSAGNGASRTDPHAAAGPAAAEPPAGNDDLASLIGAVAELPGADFDRSKPFAAQGLSAMAQERLLQRIKNAYGVSSTPLSLESCDSVEKLEAFLRAARLFQIEKVEHSSNKRKSDAVSLRDRRTMQDFYEVRDRDLFAKTRHFSAFYRDRKNEQLYWYGMALQTPCTNRVVIYDELAGRPREFLMMASNNYLGLANHPRVIEAIRDATSRYGATNTGCRIIGGTNLLHKELERRMAAFKGTESCIVFPSGYSANLGTISALVRKQDAVVSDKFNHMSILDGCKLSGGALRIYQHSDMEDLERVLARCDADHQGKLIVTDGVFSMHGDICNLPKIVELAQKYGARVLVDDAHATGVIGRTGSGTSEHFDMKGEVDLELGTFSKTLAGVGGFVCGSEEVVEYLRFYANSYVFAATIPAGVVAGLIAALDVLQSEPERITRLWDNIHYFRKHLLDLGFNVENSRSAIVPIVIGEYEKTLLMGRGIRERGLFCQTVVYPGVARGDERLRPSLSSDHTQEDIDLALDILATTGKELGVIS